jgi:hypothetical protein
MTDPELREVALQLLPYRRQRLIEELTDNSPDLTSAACTDFHRSVSRYADKPRADGAEQTATPKKPPRRRWGVEGNDG